MFTTTEKRTLAKVASEEADLEGMSPCVSLPSDEKGAPVFERPGRRSSEITSGVSWWTWLAETPFLRDMLSSLIGTR